MKKLILFPLLFVVLPSVFAAASAQTPDDTGVTTFIIRADYLDGPTDFRLPNGEIATAADFHGSVRAFVGEIECGSVSLTDGSNRAPEGKLLRIGGPSQPDVCSRASQTLRFFNASGHKFQTEEQTQPGATIEFNPALSPPGSEVIPPAATPRAVTPPDTGSGSLVSSSSDITSGGPVPVIVSLSVVASIIAGLLVLRGKSRNRRHT